MHIEGNLCCGTTRVAYSWILFWRPTENFSSQLNLYKYSTYSCPSHLNARSA